MSSLKSSIFSLKSSILSALLAAGMLGAFAPQAEAVPTGGTITTYDGYTVHTFTNGDNFVVDQTIYNVGYLIVGGGGAGGDGWWGSAGGGGGGGGGNGLAGGSGGGGGARYNGSGKRGMRRRWQRQSGDRVGWRHRFAGQEWRQRHPLLRFRIGGRGRRRLWHGGV